MRSAVKFENCKGNNMKTLAIAIAAVAGFLMINHWGTPEALAWTVAFCGWLPHAFDNSKEVTHGDQA